MKTDTIAAIATPVSHSGIGIIRVSGEDSIRIVDQIYQSKKKNKGLADYKSHTIHYGYIADGEQIIDEVMVSIMKKPSSFTAEDTVEINCHGGVFVMNQILKLVLKKGARLAEPGEFTKRAFLNGRIDLSEAEAVMDVISSQSEMALKSSVSQLRGNIFNKIKELRDSIIYEIAFIESALDDPEHISLSGYSDQLNHIVDRLLMDVNQLLDTAENGKIIREGINAVIVGKPNAGKSSFLNFLIGEERAIVTEIAGTTRDIIEETIRIGGIVLHVIDTAGIRSTEDLVEKIGVEKAKKYAGEADLIIYIVDSSVAVDDSDYEIIQLTKNKKCIVLFNKSDLKTQVSMKELEDLTGKDTKIIRTSIKENTGMDEFEQTVRDMFLHGGLSVNDEIMITNTRHRQALTEALESLKQVKQSLENHMPEDFYSIDLMGAYGSLGKIIGEEVEDDLVNEIFAKFCMGK